MDDTLRASVHHEGTMNADSPPRQVVSFISRHDLLSHVFSESGYEGWQSSLAGKRHISAYCRHCMKPFASGDSRGYVILRSFEISGS